MHYSLNELVVRKLKAFLVVASLCLLGVIGWYLLFAREDTCTSVFSPSRVMVPNEAVAIGIAEAVLVPVFGEQVKRHRPFTAELKDSVWWVKGSVLSHRFGGAPVVVIQMKDARIVDLYHEK
jgi:hypothetical protein